ncbi:MAG TPA: microcystin degradation protein MlrC [Candidatus Latescibacteria bacterium]|nr:microcystin degradation protein MlrC [Candidatus Latescibacterota bacterium]
MRILIAAFKQETSSFNPQPTTKDLFSIHRGEEILHEYTGTNTELAGALDVFSEHGIDVVSTYSAQSITSGGPVPASDLDSITDELTEAIEANKNVDGAYINFHGAMAGEKEIDPEGRVIEMARAILGDIPIVTSFDLHAIISDRLVDLSDILVAFHTYPHTDMYATGQRAARNLIRLLTEEIQPTVARVRVPLLVRGDELLTATGLFGQAINTCIEFESTNDGLSAAVIIGNPFTDVPNLRTNIIVTTNNDPRRAQEVAEGLARFMWNGRDRMQASLASIDDAIRIANETEGLTVFSDAADATSSGASGDSNAILRELLNQGFSKTALLPLVDGPAVAKAFESGVGSTIKVQLGGNVDTVRHKPIDCEAYIQSLHDGVFRVEQGTVERAGRTAVLLVGTCTVMVTTNPVSIMGRKVFETRGLNPVDFDLCVCKSPNGFRTYFNEIAGRIVPVDAPGSTSANLRSLPFTQVPRPIYPLDTDLIPDLTAELKS